MAAPGAGTLAPIPSTDLKRCLTPANFALAWDRLLRSTEPSFKWYWRPSAAIASTIATKLLDRLRKEVKAGTFHPDHVCLFSEPKASGLLRHKSILSIGDLIAYQAIVNVVADRLYMKIKPRYGVSVFGNLYSGPKDKFFMLDWRRSYQAFNDANRTAHASGTVWLAQFDFASFYDSIGHQVLSTILQEQFGVGADLCAELVRLLGHWSSAAEGDGKRLPRIYLEHGIPQGPQPSPILAEAILAYIDEQMVKLPSIRYLRYADDIRIWGGDESSVRYAAAILDRLARNVGVYPQARKFQIEKVEDVEEILKTVSIPRDVPEPDDRKFSFLEDELKGQPPIRLLWEILRHFAETGEVEDVTRFKFILGASKAISPIAEQLCELMKARPELTETCCYYIERCEKPHPKLLDSLIALVSDFPEYPWMSGRVLRAVWTHLGAAKGTQRTALKMLVAEFAKRKGIRSDCQLHGIVRIFATELKAIPTAEIEAWATDSGTPWWGVVYFVLNAPSQSYGEAGFIGLLQRLLTSGSQEVCRAAAYRLCLLGQLMPNQTMDSQGECRAVFSKHGLATRARTSTSRLNHLLRELGISFGLKAAWFRRVDWRGLLGASHEDVLKYAVRLLAEHRASRDQFIMCLDSAMEALFDALWVRGGYANVDVHGNSLRSSTRGCRLRSNTAFSTAFPETHRYMRAVNDLRNRSEVAHRKNTFSRTRNRAVSYDDVNRAMKLMPPAIIELASSFPEA